MKPPVIVNHFDQKLQDHMDKLTKVLKKISFGASVPNLGGAGLTMISNNEPDRNLDIWKFTGTTPNMADTDFTLTHGLGRIPFSIVAQDTTNGGLIYRSPATGWTTTTVTFRCTKASSAFIVAIG